MAGDCKAKRLDVATVCCMWPEYVEDVVENVRHAAPPETEATLGPVMPFCLHCIQLDSTRILRRQTAYCTKTPARGIYLFAHRLLLLGVIFRPKAYVF